MKKDHNARVFIILDENATFTPVRSINGLGPQPAEQDAPEAQGYDAAHTVEIECTIDRITGDIVVIGEQAQVLPLPKSTREN